MPIGALAQDVPSYAVAQQGVERIQGRIQSFDGQYYLTVRDDRGFIDQVRIHPGTIINPTGITLRPGMVVSIIGANYGDYFSGDEVDTPYNIYNGNAYFQNQPWTAFGTGLGLGVFFGSLAWWHGNYFNGYNYAYSNGFRRYAIPNYYPGIYNTPGGWIGHRFGPYGGGRISVNRTNTVTNIYNNSYSNRNNSFSGPGYIGRPGRVNSVPRSAPAYTPGYNARGYNASGYNARGYNASGYNAPGYNARGYGASGYNARGYGASGYNARGYAGPGSSVRGTAPGSTPGYNGRGYTPPATTSGSTFNTAGYLPPVYRSNGASPRINGGNVGGFSTRPAGSNINPGSSAGSFQRGGSFGAPNMGSMGGGMRGGGFNGGGPSGFGGGMGGRGYGRR